MISNNTLAAELAATLHEARDAERQLLAHCVDGAGAVDEPWSAKDHVAHLAAWRRHAVDVLRAAARVEDLAAVPDIDSRNAAIFAEHRAASAADVVAMSAASYATLIDVLLRSDPTATARSRRAVIADGVQHVADHLGYWHAEHGDHAAAERSAQWAHEVIERHVDDAVCRGIAGYNLACYYGRSGRSAEVPPLLRRALLDAPDLRRTAANDPDLDPVRNDQEVRSLLG